MLKPGHAHLRRALDKVEAAYTIVSADTETLAYPRVTIRTNSWFPFVISEHFYIESEAVRRIEFTSHCPGIFGIALPVGDSFDIPS